MTGQAREEEEEEDVFECRMSSIVVSRGIYDAAFIATHFLILLYHLQP